MDQQSNPMQTETFLIRVNREQGQPWRGDVIWVSERCEQTFSSIRELIELLHAER